MTLLICPACKEVGQAGDGGPDVWYMCPACGYYFYAKEASSPPEGTIARACPPLLTRESREDPGGGRGGACG